MIKAPKPIAGTKKGGMYDKVVSENGGIANKGGKKQEGIRT